MADFTVTTVAELESTITSSANGDTIELLASGSPYNLTQTLQVNKELTIFGASRTQVKIFLPVNTTINVTAPNTTIRGLEIEGVHATNNRPTNDPNTVGIVIREVDNCIIEDCEIHKFSFAGIDLKSSQDTQIRRNFIHTNRQTGLGYGVVHNGNSYSFVYNNTFDFNREHIAGTGQNDQGYEFYSNEVGRPGIAGSHAVDIHGLPGQFPRKVLVHHNNFLDATEKSIVIRGVSAGNSEIYQNNFAHKCSRSAIRQLIDGVVIGQNEVNNLNIYNNYYSQEPTSSIKLDQNVIVVDDDFDVLKYRFGDECSQYEYIRQVGVGFNNYKNFYAGNWTKGTKDDLLVETSSGKFLIIPYKNETFNGNSFVQVDDSLRDYDKLYVGKVNITDDQLIGTNDTGTFLIDVSATGTVSATQLTNITGQFQDIVCGYISQNSFMDIFGYRADGETVLYRNTSGTLDTGTVLGTFPGHSNFLAADFINNGFDDVASYLAPNMYLFRFNAGTLLNGEPTVRSGSGFVSYSEIKKIDVEGSPSLLGINLNNDLDVIEYTGSSFNLVSPVGWLPDYTKVITGNF